MGRVVLVTGVSQPLPARLASALAGDPRVDRVVGLASTADGLAASWGPDGVADERMHAATSAAVDVVHADPRGGGVAAAVERVRPDVVVHLGLVATPTQVGGRGAMKEINVIGSMHLLAACQRSATVRRVVLGSTAAVYGSSPRDPALIAEDVEPAAAPRSGWGKDCLEVEGYARGLARRRPGIGVLALRFADVVGAGSSSPLTDYLTLPAVPTVLGYDPRLQFVHADDALACLIAATFGDAAGAVNVAGDGVLLLSQAVHLAGRMTVPVLPVLAGLAAGALGRTRIGEVSADQQAFLRYGRCLDTTRMREDLGVVAARSTRQAWLAHLRAHGAHARSTGGAVADELVSPAGGLS